MSKTVSFFAACASTIIGLYSYAGIIPDISDKHRRVYPVLEARRAARAAMLLKTQAVPVKVEEPLLPKPPSFVEVTPQHVASNTPVPTAENPPDAKAGGVQTLSGTYGTILVRAVADVNNLQLMVQYPGFGWTILGDATFPRTYKLVGFTKTCAKLVPPEEAQSNYYDICVDKGRLIIKPVGEVEPLS